MRLQRVVPPIAELAEAFPGWRPWHAWAQGELQRVFGELAAARRYFELALQLAPAGEHRAWVVVQPAYASLLLAQGELEAARACALEAIETTLALDLDRTAAIYSGRVLALCESRLGHHEAAVAALDRAFELAKTIEMGGLPLATCGIAAVANPSSPASHCSALLTIRTCKCRSPNWSGRSVAVCTTPAMFSFALSSERHTYTRPSQTARSSS